MAGAGGSGEEGLGVEQWACGVPSFPNPLKAERPGVREEVSRSKHIANNLIPLALGALLGAGTPARVCPRGRLPATPARGPACASWPLRGSLPRARSILHADPHARPPLSPGQGYFRPAGPQPASSLVTRCLGSSPTSALLRPFPQAGHTAPLCPTPPVSPSEPREVKLQFN